jgi:cobalt-zinc-cadmium efflux system membrane fusion protein
MKPIKNYILFFALLVVCFLFVSCQTEEKKEEIKQTFVLSDKMLQTTTTAEVEVKTLKNKLNFYGKITADGNKLIEVFPVVGGNVSRVFVELGDYVKKGDILATIKSTEVAGFEKELEDAKNDILLAKKNLQVANDLFEGKLSSERDVIQAKSELEKAQTQLNRIQETYGIYNLKKGAIYEVRSPISGFVIEKKINQDMLLRSDKTDNIFDIAEIDDVWAIANVNESDIGQIKLGVHAEVTTLSYPDKKFEGKVDKIFNIIDTETKAMKVRIKLENKDYLLKPEMRATIQLSFDEEKVMLAIPSSAIIFDASRNYVMIYKDRNNIETRPIEVFRQVGDITYILSGLEAKEKVITNNQLLIYDALND